MEPGLVDSEKVRELLNKFGSVADNEWNYTVFTAASLFLAKLIQTSDIEKKEEFIDVLAAHMKTYLRMARSN